MQSVKNRKDGVGNSDAKDILEMLSQSEDENDKEIQFFTTCYMNTYYVPVTVLGAGSERLSHSLSSVCDRQPLNPETQINI